MSKSIQNYIRENISVISKILFIYAIGLLIGIALFVFTDIKNGYVDVVRSVFDNSRLENFEGINIITNGIRNNLIYIAILYFSLITIITPLIICFLVLLKALVTGIYFCSIFTIFGFFKGIVVSFISIIIPVLFSLIGYTIICTNIISLFKCISQGEKNDIKNMFSHIYFLVIAVSLISFSIVVEQLMTGLSLSMYANIL